MAQKLDLSWVLIPTVVGAFLLSTAAVIAVRSLAPRQVAAQDKKEQAILASTPKIPEPDRPQPKPQVNIPRAPEKKTSPTTPDIRPRVLEERPSVPVVLEPPPAKPDAGRSTLPPELQERVNKAIDRGVKYLETTQDAGGSWQPRYHSVALAALPALTLLECGTPADDPRIQKAAKFIRDNVAKVEPGVQTYTFSLVILFLDRLGEAGDETLLRTLALRIIAGQEPDGGWHYSLPTLTPKDAEKFHKALAMVRPRDLKRLTQSFEEQRKLERITSSPGTASLPPEKKAGYLKPLDGPAASEEDIEKAIQALPAALRNVPGVSDTPKKTTRIVKTRKGRTVTVGGRSDNSNTHFAVLALWASLRHGVPAERSLRRVAERFDQTQRLDGRWNYTTSPLNGHGSEAMTGVGLLGLAMGHGLADDKEIKSALEDSAVKKGLKALGKFLGPTTPRNLYFLWAMERVGVLYGLHEIEGKDWYRYAVDLILPAQHAEGSWHMGSYHGSTRILDTCLALLILKRSNLTPELTRQLSTGLIKLK